MSAQAPGSSLFDWVPAPEPNEALDRAAAARQARRAAFVKEKAVRHDLLKNKGNEAFKRGDYDEAYKCFTEAIVSTGYRTGTKRGHAAMPSLLNLTFTCLKLNKFEKAEATASMVLEADPKNVKARYRRGLARMGLKWYHAAITDFEAVLKLDPTCKEARFELGRARKAFNRGESGHVDGTTSEEDEPSPDAPPESDDDGSDSSDFDHLGNGTPCRFYNQLRCTRGSSCAFSHGPDDRAIRDNLGRNVCTAFIFGRCTFPPDQCYFAHSVAYLPTEVRDGKEYKWWEDKMVLKRGRIQWDFNVEDARINARRQGRTPRRLLANLNARQLTSAHKSRGDRSAYGRAWNNGFTDEEVAKLTSQGVSIYDDDAAAALEALRI